MSKLKDNKSDALPQNQRTQSGELDLILEDLSLLLSHDLEKTASSTRMFFEIFRKETPSSKELQKWSQATERSWIEPMNWIQKLLPIIPEEGETSNLLWNQEIQKLCTKIGLDPSFSAVEPSTLGLPEKPFKDICELLAEHLRRKFSHKSTKMEIHDSREQIEIKILDLETREDILPGQLISKHLCVKILTAYQVSHLFNDSSLELKFRKV